MLVELLGSGLMTQVIDSAIHNLQIDYGQILDASRLCTPSFLSRSVPVCS